MEVEGLVRGVLAGERRAVARAISLVEDGRPELERLSAGIYGATGRAVTVGITGAPGVGKSTLAGALVGAVRADERRVAVLAVDPTSPYTGGALLGDRVRMQEHTTDPDVFIRSMATRRHLGGMAPAAPDVGGELRQMLRLGPKRDWDPPVRAVAATTGDVSVVWAAVEEHDGWARTSGARDAKRRARLLAEVESLAAERFKLGVAAALADDPALVTDLPERRVDAY